nr:probable E3 ubiquitin-protein ligase RHY1A [Ipomoea batatas]
MATVTYRPSIRVTFESRLRSGRDRMRMMARRVSLARHDLNDGIMVVMARVEIDEPDMEEVYIEGSGDDGGGIPSNVCDNNNLVDYEGDDELSSSLPRGLTLSEINGLKQEGFKSSGGGAEEEWRCSICLEEFSKGVNITTLPCSHRFHHSCIATWLERQASCPLCRLHITPP